MQEKSCIKTPVFLRHKRCRDKMRATQGTSVKPVTGLIKKNQGLRTIQLATILSSAQHKHASAAS